MLVWIAQTCLRITELSDINPIAAMHVYEVALAAWQAYCSENHTDPYTCEVWTRALDTVRPKGVA